MTILETTITKLQQLPEPLLQEVNDFIDLMIDRHQSHPLHQAKEVTQIWQQKAQALYPDQKTADYMESQGQQFDEHLMALKQKYAGQYVCFENGSVLDFNASRTELARSMRQKFGDKLFFIEKVPAT
jgi:tRNA splicing ligase